MTAPTFISSSSDGCTTNVPSHIEFLNTAAATTLPSFPRCTSSLSSIYFPTHIYPSLFIVPPLVIYLYPLLYLPVSRVIPVLQTLTLWIVCNGSCSHLLRLQNDIQRIRVMISGNTTHIQTPMLPSFHPAVFLI